MTYDFKSIWVIGASSGIGKAVAERLAKDGVEVAISARSEDKLNAIAATNPDKITAWPVDVSDEALVKESAQKLDEHFGWLGAVLYCAAAWDPTNDQQINPAAFEKSLDINIMGAVRMLAAVGPAMEQRGQGRIGIISSVAGYRGLPNAAEYGTTKAALIHLCESLRFKYADVGVTLQVITPGFVETPLTDKNEFPMPFIISPEKAADYICKGMQTNNFEITFPKRFTYQLKALRMLPHKIYFPMVGKATKGKA
ncbi:MAG: SDR family NAD(P)-dependent oxidoreductase [Sphingomonadales bacterium]